MTTAKRNTATKGTCTHCGKSVATRSGWFGVTVVDFHGQVGGGAKGRGIAGRCAGSRLPTRESGQDVEQYKTKRAAEVAAMPKP